MPATLSGSLIDTGSLFKDCVDNVQQLIREHLPSLAFKGKDLLEKNVVNYDEIKVYHTPFVSVVFEAARQTNITIGKCSVIAIDLLVYYYMESLSFGNDTNPYLDPMYRLMELFLVHTRLYGFTVGTATGMEVPNTALVGRRLDADVFLTAQLNLTVYARLCTGGHS